MKIAFILPSLANAGPIVFTKYLIEGLKNKVKYIEVFYFKDIVEINLLVPTKKISFFNKIDFKKFDIIHTTMIKADLYSWYHKKKIHNKSVLSVHNYLVEDLEFNYNPIKAYIYAKLWIVSLKSISNIIVSSNDQLKYYQKLLGGGEYALIPYGINKRKLMELNQKDENFLENLRKKYKIIGSCGLLIERKGFKQLIEFLNKNNEYAVVIIGDGEDRKNLEDLSKKYKLEDRFILLGFKHNSIDYYKYFDIYAMTSYSEGFGLAMLEAMSQGLPVLCSNLPIYKEFFGQQDVALFEVDNIKSLEIAITNLNNHRNYYKTRSYKLFKEKFSLDVMSNKHIEFYEYIIKRNKCEN